MDIPKNYNHDYVESKWLSNWDLRMYQFRDSDKKSFIIDTPPPYPTGNFHMGNALNWCYIDFIARYKRMKGLEVMFPQGWDCHGLPTEVKVERMYSVTKNQIPRHEFRGLCENLTHENIALMKQTMKRLAFSIDWTQEFTTMNKEYDVKTQQSFIQMYKSGCIYRSEHPVNWCPRCETAIAFAEVDYKSRSTTLNYIRFKGRYGNEIDIATTRPELLSACVAVAVNPNDERYSHLVGKKLKVPLYDHEIKVIADEDVDSDFGTGAVMICTFGDKQDVRWWKEHNLPLRQAIAKDGRLIDNRYKGMTIKEGKLRIIGDLENNKFLYKQEHIEQNIGVHDRCETPIEILSEKQWFVRVNKEAILKRADQIQWIPTYALTRLKKWTESLDWDWCISRQRVFATPIPVWYCQECGKIMVAEENWLPLDPTEDEPKKRCGCGSNKFTPETDVLDTWMDSSISALHVSGWPNKALFDERFPTQLRPQGHDIIRTWAFYTILRSDALVSKKPWEYIVVNGMVLGEDGQKMSKSFGNIIAPETIIKEYGTDALRQWAAIGGSYGSDIAYSLKDVIASMRFLTKLWNVFRFSMIHLSKGVNEDIEFSRLKTTDQWLILKLNELTASVTENMEEFEFDEALKKIRVFVWDTLADNYIELAKGRLYNGDKSAKFTLHTALGYITKLLAPFCPFFTEELFFHLSPDSGSVHMQCWPEVDVKVRDFGTTKGAEALATPLQSGELIKSIASGIRRYKSEHKIALNARMGSVKAYLTRDIKDGKDDINNAVNAEIEFKTGKPKLVETIREIQPNMNLIGPRFKSEAKKIVDLIKTAPVDTIAAQLPTGVIQLDGYELKPSEMHIVREQSFEGIAVDVVALEGATILIRK